MDPTLEDRIRAAHIVQGAAFGALEVPLSAALMASIVVQTIAFATAPAPKSLSWGIMMVASTSIGWGIAHTLRAEVYNTIRDRRRAAKGIASGNLNNSEKEDEKAIDAVEFATEIAEL